MGSDAPYCLAIDIGSSSIKAAAVYDGGSFRNFEIGFNNNPTEFPTYLAVTHSGAVLIGEEAKDHSTIEPHETLTNIKYLFNRKLERMTLPFPVDRCGGQVSVRVQHHNQRLNVPAHAIYGAFLAAAKERVEAILDQQCLTAVVTIPSDFSNEQKIAVEGASRLAGFTQVETMNEVIAAASYFYHMRNLQNEQFVIVCNFGASSSEIALVQICNNNDFAVLRRQTLLDITGDALDEKLLMHCLRSMNTSAIHSVRNSAESLKQNLRLQCEAARISLSNKREASVDVGSVMGTESSSNVPVDREFFESMSDLWTALRNTLRDILQLAVSKTKRPIHIILTGGVSRTPKIRSVIEECSQGMNVQITTNVNLCNNAVVYGGALRAKAAFPEEFCYSVNRGPEELNLQDRIWRTLESAPLAPESGFGGLEQLSPTPSRRSGVSSRSTSSNNTSSSSISRASQQPDIFRFIGNELLTTERKYVQDLYFIVSECMPYFQQNELLAPSVIGRRHLIFANLEDIYLFHRIFLTDMESCELTPSTIGHLFCQYEQEFEKHALFCRKQAESTRKGLIAAANRFFEDQKFVFSREDGGLGTCLTKPFQRLVKYKEFLKRLITKCLEAGLNEDLPVLQAALEKMEFFLHHGDDLAHQDLIVDHAGVALNQQGRLLRQNEMLVVVGRRSRLMQRPRRRVVFLFENMIILTKWKAGNEDRCLKYKRHIRTDEIGLVEDPNASNASVFQVFIRTTRDENIFECEAKDEETKRSWVKDIRRILEIQATHHAPQRLQRRPVPKLIDRANTIHVTNFAREDYNNGSDDLPDPILYQPARHGPNNRGSLTLPDDVRTELQQRLQHQGQDRNARNRYFEV